MQVLSTFAVAFLVSFIGTLPPGTVNLTIIHLGINHRIRTALIMAVAAALIEYPYTSLAVEFQDFIRSSDLIANFKLLGSVLMIAIGIINLLSVRSASGQSARHVDRRSRTGIVLGVLNPVAIPFWIGMTAYIKSRGWVTLSDNMQLHAYLLGVSTGTLAVFIPLACVAQRFVSRFRTSSLLARAPGALMVAMGVYALVEYILG